MSKRDRAGFATGGDRRIAVYAMAVGVGGGLSVWQVGQMVDYDKMEQ